MGDGVKVGVVTVTYNSRGVIDGFLMSLLQQTYSNFALYIIDNASTDETLDRVLEYVDARIVVISNEKNLGVAEGNNQGIKAALAADCAAVLLINNDTEFESTLLKTLVEGLTGYACDMIAPKILFHDNQKIIWCAGGGFRPWRGYMGIHYGIGQIDRGQFDVARKVEHAPTCCLLVQENVFARIGFMDSRYFVYTDDTDFCFRAARAGLKLFYLPSARLLHKASSLTGGAESDFAVRYCTRNHIYFVFKNLGFWLGVYHLSDYQLRLLVKLVLRKIGVARFILQQRALIEGLRIWRDSPVPRLHGDGAKEIADNLT
jgi:GT2 family glycosyltransferase